MRQGFFVFKDSKNKSAEERSKVMAMLTDKKEGIPEIGIKKLSNLESSIVDTMHRYFTVTSGTSKDPVEISIIEASKRYFEGYANA
jgi:hypothetical protein